jgi:glycerophosphoryl diester phosphodiesterase
MRVVGIILLVLTLGNAMQAQRVLIKQGHRGCRGLMPENTIAAMKKALDLGVDVLEVDVVVSKDNQVVVSHDPYLSALITLKPSGDSISKEEQKKLVLYSMPYSEIRKYDVGSKHNLQFPEQQNFPAYIPLLSELIDSTDLYAKENNMPPPNYNIEIKSQPKTDGINHPEPDKMVALVMDVCRNRNILNRMNIQSFDVRPLQIIHQKHPDVKLSFLTMNQKTLDENFKELGFTPPLYSPYYKTVTKEVVQACHKKGVKIIPWTVNTKAEIVALADLGVDGIITDYPNLFSLNQTSSSSTLSN